MSTQKASSNDILNLLRERDKTHGNYQTLSMRSQHLKDIVRDCPGWSQIPDPGKEAIEMILLKISRIVNGDPWNMDSWQDIAGYAMLARMALVNDNKAAEEAYYGDEEEA